MTDKEKMIAEAAIRVFARYGVKRATMADVAAEAGVVRQTLYNVYPNKDAVLCGAIRLYTDTQLDRVREAWSEGAPLSERLDVLCEHFVIAPWELLRNSPDAQELERGFNAAGRKEIARATRMTKAFLAEAFEPYAPALAVHGLDPAGLADFVKTSMIGIKSAGESRDHVLGLVAALKAAVLCLTGEG